MTNGLAYPSKAEKVLLTISTSVTILHLNSFHANEPVKVKDECENVAFFRFGFF